LVGKCNRNSPFRKLTSTLYGRIILKWILLEYDWRAWAEFVCLETGPSGELF
jgi:hypothetical protein